MTDYKKIGLLLCSDVPSVVESFDRKAQALLDSGHKVYAYLLHTGIKHFSAPVLTDLAAKGLHLHVCSLAAEKYGIPFSERAVFCGLGTLASILLNTDSFLCFSRHSSTAGQICTRQTALLTAGDSLTHTNGDTLETLRVAAGLAQLSRLSIHLQLCDNALTFLDQTDGNPDLIPESTGYLRLLQDAGGTLFLPREISHCPISYQLISQLSGQALLLSVG